MRDKERIRPFLDEFISLWEQKPELRFGQIISGLPRYFEKPTDSLFYIEEEAILAALRRYFKRSDWLQKSDVRNEERRKIIDGWEELFEKLTYDANLIADEFKLLFQKTWKYFMTYGDLNTLDLSDVSIVSGLTRFAFFNTYPTNIESWEFDACVALAKGLLFSIENPKGGYRGKLFDGYIMVEVYCHDEQEVKIDELNQFYKELCEIYEENDC